jgi:hypothetical protein
MRYIVEILISAFYFSFVVSNKNMTQYIFKILFIIILSINCFPIFNGDKAMKDFIVDEKLKSDFELFLNHELCIYAFNNYLFEQYKYYGEFLIKLYFDIVKHKLKFALNGVSNDIKEIYLLCKDNIHLVSDKMLKNKLKDIIDIGQITNDELNEIYKINYDILYKKFEDFKKTRDFDNLFSFLDLIIFLDEYIFKEPLYFDYTNNEELL